MAKGDRDSLASHLKVKLRQEASPVEIEFMKKLTRLVPNLCWQRAFLTDHKIHIVDFYLPTQKVVIEIDGKQHLEKEHAAADRSRDAYLRSRGCIVIRIQAKDAIDYDIKALLKSIPVKYKKKTGKSAEWRLKWAKKRYDKLERKGVLEDIKNKTYYTNRRKKVA